MLKRINISFSLKERDYIIYDKTGSDDFSNLFNKQDVFVLNTRLAHINKIYLSRKIFLSILKNIFKYRLKENYLIAIINEINPEIVITRIDNAPEFWNLAKYFQNKIKFIAVQNATRGD